jgi:hypothetical protein
MIMNKLFSVLTFIFIAFGIFGIMHLIQTNQDNLQIKDLQKIVDREIQEFENFKKKHIDSH